MNVGECECLPHSSAHLVKVHVRFVLSVAPLPRYLSTVDHLKQEGLHSAIVSVTP